MWKIISTDEEIRTFLDFVSCFHDSCIKEMHYISGAYVDEDYSRCKWYSRLSDHG